VTVRIPTTLVADEPLSDDAPPLTV
jgi:hypothetical protein